MTEGSPPRDATNDLGSADGLGTDPEPAHDAALASDPEPEDDAALASDPEPGTEGRADVGPGSRPLPIRANRQFMMVLGASFVSNVGRWMQQVVLGILAWELTESPAFTTRVVFAQFVPMLLLAVVGGTVADSIDRRRLLIVTQLWQAVFAIVLSVLVFDGEIATSTLLAVVFASGVAQAFFAPAFSAVLPTLVDREQLGQAISINSTQINASRVVGPALGAWLATAYDMWLVFAINGFSYLAVITALFLLRLPANRPPPGSALVRLASGFRIAAGAEQIRRPLVMMATFALLCLPFIGLMPVIAELNLGVDARSTAYGLLYAVFGAGAVTGAASVSTGLRSVPAQTLIRVALAGFAVSLALVAVQRSILAAYPNFFFLGMFYFMYPTALTTFMQQHLSDEIRGRIMALWVLSFGGVIPINNLLAGPAVEGTSISTVLLVGAVVAVMIGFAARLRPGPEYGDILDAASDGEKPGDGKRSTDGKKPGRRVRAS